MSEFIFIKQLDQKDNDILFNKCDINQMKSIALKHENIAGFNTLGFFKNKIDMNKLESSPYFTPTDGIYIKKSSLSPTELSKIKTSHFRVKMICNWCTSEQLCKEFSNMCESGYTYKNLEITSDDHDIDYYVIINYPIVNQYFDKKRTIIFTMEPLCVNRPWGVNNWPLEWKNPSVSEYLSVRGRYSNCHNNAFWQINMTLPQLENLTYDTKDDTTLSAIMSSKYFDPGHILRIDFLKFLETKTDIKLDIYGYDNNFKFKNYRYPVYPYINKSKGIVPYKYFFAVENNFEKNFITEKLYEPILCETLVFYFGCPNVHDYIDKDAFVLLDLNDFEKSYEIIKKAIEEDWWTQRINVIKKEKQKILNEMCFFPVIHKIINENVLAI